ncbi:MAG: class II glutamine amidotransferase [Candidatus Thermoplasmatota archaeon]|nr:class II glutamine amidotransferase [Candidatus Thermoplasmatota archaeon]MCL6003534.1 class II glutamine amidotransferase [Candidatus Thermoplasmatota archaeon]
MCRMLLSIGKYSDLTQYMDFVYEMANEGKHSPHHDGFGYVLYSKNEIMVQKSIDPIRKVEGIYGNAILAHARKKSSSGKTIINTQPFLADNISFAHNGTIKGMGKKGKSDSYHYFRLVLRGFPAAITKIREMEFTSINFLITDGNYAAAYREVRKEPGYYSLFYQLEDERFTVSTEAMGGKWFEIEDKTLVVFRNGRVNEYKADDVVPEVI